MVVVHEDPRAASRRTSPPVLLNLRGLLDQPLETVIEGV